MHKGAVVKLSLFMVIALLGLVNMNGCGKNGSWHSKAITGLEVEKETSDIDMDLHMIVDTNSGNLLKSYEEFISEYESNNRELRIKCRAIPKAQYRTWMLSGFAARNAPEMLETKYSWSMEDFGKGYVYGLDKYLQEENPYQPGQKWVNAFNPALLRQIQKPEYDILSAVPLSTSSAMVFYNVEIFKRAGINEIPGDWKSFMKVHRKLSDMGFEPFVIPNAKQEDNIYSWALNALFEQSDRPAIEKLDTNGDGFVQFDEIFCGVSENRIDLASGNAIGALNTLKDWSRYWFRGYNETGYEDALNIFLMGDAAMGLFFSNQLAAIDQSSKRKFAYGYFPFPPLTDEQPAEKGRHATFSAITPDHVICISTGTRNKQLEISVDFLRFMTSGEIQKKRADKYSFLPSVKGVNMNVKYEGFLNNNKPLLIDYFSEAASTHFSSYAFRLGQLYLNDEIDTEYYASRMNTEFYSSIKGGR